MKKRILWTVAVTITAFAVSLNAFAQPGGGQGGGRQGGQQPGGGQQRGQGQNPGGPGGFMPGGGAPGMPGQPGGPGMGAQPGMPPGGMGFGRMGMGGMGNFLQNPEFAKMLDLTSEQTDALQKIAQDIGEEIRTTIGGFQGTETMPNFNEIGQAIGKITGGAQEKINGVLKPEQRTKASEMAFQLTGGLDSPMVGMMGNFQTLDALALTDAQKEQLTKLLEERNAANLAAIQDVDIRGMSQAEREAFRTEREAANAKYAEQIKGVLTDEQKAKAEKLTAGAAELRDKLGMTAPGQQGQAGQQRGMQQGNRQPAGPYSPREGSWTPGQGTNAGPQQPPQEGNFPRRSGGNAPPPGGNPPPARPGN